MYRKRTFKFLIEYEGFLLPRDSRELRADKGISIYLCSRLIVYVWAKRTLITKSSPCRSVAFTRCTWACPSRATIQGRRVGVELFRRASFPSLYENCCHRFPPISVARKRPTRLPNSTPDPAQPKRGRFAAAARTHRRGGGEVGCGAVQQLRAAVQRSSGLLGG